VKYTAAIAFFGSVMKVAEKLGISDKAVYKWKYAGGIVPELTAYKLLALSKGKLAVEEDDYAKATSTVAPARLSVGSAVPRRGRRHGATRRSVRGRQ
jgi:hypothetical protein